ncbi:MAG: 30S ribosomal protein S17e [Candidatus Hydrothermarchaeaceae archaeon]
MGRIRQKYIKRTALYAVRRYEKDLTLDFKKNREFLDKVLKIQGKFLKNKISGYVTHLLKQKR